MRLIFLFLTALLTVRAQNGVTSLLTKNIPEFKGKEVIMLTVDLVPGQASPAHRHQAHVFVYVLEGSVVMQVAGGPAQELGPGGTFYEKPTDVHTVSRNASTTKPAKILVVMLKDQDKPVTEPAPK